MVEELLKIDAKAERTISHTTRKPRPGEIEGMDYHFTDRAAFLEEKKKGYFLETAEVYDHFYGTSIQSVETIFAKGKDAFLVIEWQGAEKLKNRYPDLVRILLLPPTAEDLKGRIESRKKVSADEIKKRLSFAQGELRMMMDYDYFVFNDTVKKAVYKLRNIVEAERLKMHRNRGMLHRFVDAFEVIKKN